jgi:hypothetical protein
MNQRPKIKCPYCGAMNNGYYKGTCPQCPRGQKLKRLEPAPPKTIIVRLYTTDNNQLSSYVEMSEEDYAFLSALERTHGDLSHAGFMLRKWPEKYEAGTLERLESLLEKYEDDSTHVDGPPGICTYA